MVTSHLRSLRGSVQCSLSSRVPGPGGCSLAPRSPLPPSPLPSRREPTRTGTEKTMDLNVNGATHTVDDRHETTPLLWVLRDVLGLHAVKFGCGSGFCAACTVWVDGKATKSCQTAARRVVGKAVHTADAAEGPQMDALRSTWYRNN